MIRLPFPLRTPLLLLAALAAAATPVLAGRQGRIDIQKLQTPLYTVEGDAFVRHNEDHYNNRPLYLNQIYGAVFGGDKPFCTLGLEKTVFGSTMFALVRDGKGVWLQNASDITSKYRPGRMEWIVKDASWGDTAVHFEAVPAARGPGLAARVSVEGARPGDRIVWANGAAYTSAGAVLWQFDMISQKPTMLYHGFVPADCADDRVETHGDSWTVQQKAGKPPGATGRCSVATEAVAADAAAWADPVALLASRASALPVACGAVTVVANQPVYWSLLGPDAGAGKGPEEEFAAGMRREIAIGQAVQVDTPDAWLNAAVGASVNVADGVFREGIYSHSGMRWATALLGWRTVYGGTVFGAHDHVKTDAGIFIAKQITDSKYTEPHADPAANLSSQAPDSRMFGKGRIDLHDPHHYDMQSQFFDQVQHAWRWTGDPELEKLLRPSLDLDCEYIKDCFDPAGLGIYESYANTWPTDDQWYNGGGTSEETAYAYRAERTALQLAQRAGDQEGIQRHSEAVARIRKGFFDLLWTTPHGHPGAYREQIGHKRLHESGWLYAIFCPIDAGLLDPEQSAQALHYSEWALERDQMPWGGEQVWPSNWVPSIWSVREMWPGDDYQLALAYFQTGLADDGWKVFHGMFPQQLLYGLVPGDMGGPAGGTDFNDCNSVFARTVVEGMFGYRPDYTLGLVTVAPQFPSEWDHATIRTPDMSIAYRINGANTSCKVTLAQACALEVQVPVSTNDVLGVTVDGQPVKWEVLPGFGRSVVKVSLPKTAAANVEVTCRDALKTFPAVSLSGHTGNTLKLQADGGRIVDFHDPQGVFKEAKAQDGTVSGVLTANAGDHLVFGLTEVGATRQWRQFKIHVSDVDADRVKAEKTEVEVPPGARWQDVPLRTALNGDIRTIYQQNYVSPRPNTCSLRLASDGYSSWQMSGGGPNKKLPEINLDNLPALSDGSGHVLAGKGVPFLAPSGAKNIAFTSSWDNWPKQIEVPVNQSGDAAWFLLCGTTNPMEVRIANAELRLKYADGVVETVAIIPPFNFWTLCPFAGVDYEYVRDGFSLPKVPPTTVQLGKNCRAVALPWRLRPGVALQSVTLETLSDEVVIGLMGVSIMNPR